MSDSTATERLTGWLVLLAGGIVYLSFGYTEMAGSDLWWHVAAGRELLQTGTIWMVDDWSYTEQGSDWLNHEWLADLIYYGWVQLFGFESLVYWKWLVVVAAFLLLQLTLSRVSGSPLAGLVCAGMAAAMAAPFIDIRPHLYTLLLFCLLLYLLLGRRPRLWLLAAIFLVWVNLHGGFFFGLMALAILLFPWRDFSVDRLRAGIVVGLVCVGASALNPSGVATFFYPLKYAFDDTSPFRTLGEWLPPSQTGGIVSPLFFPLRFLLLAALLYALPAVRRRTGVPWEGIALAVLTFAMATTSRRFIPIFGISLAVMLAPLMGAALQPLRGKFLSLVLASALLWFAVWRQFPYPLQSGPAFHYLVAEFSYPVDMLNFMQRNELSGKVFAYYNWGGYLHWRTDGELKVYIDGRADTLFDAATYNNYVAVMRGEADWMERIEATGAEFVLWPNARAGGQQKLQRMFASDNWRGIYQDSTGWLLVRRGVSVPEQFRDPPPSVWRDLTLASAALHEGDMSLALANYARVRKQMPWNREACTRSVRLYAAQGDNDRAGEIQRACRSYFPSRFLP